LIEGELRNIFGRRRLERKIALLKDHYIVCGYGRMGSIVVEELLKHKLKLVVIEKDKEVTGKLQEEGIVYINGDATDEDVLLKANIKKAKALVATLPEDAENLYLTITARELNPDLFIVARSTDASVEKKMKRAGADKVVSPYRLGGVRIANALVRPETIEFIELAMEGLDVRMEEIYIGKDSPFANKKLRDSSLRGKYDTIVVAIRRGKSTYIFNPGPDEKILPGDIIIVIGKASMLEQIMKDNMATK
jgi:voltage-gated potassium channel